MKKIVLEFIHRGLTACGFGPLALVVIYLISQHHGGIDTLTVKEVCLGIVSLSVLAFVAGGMNVIYQIERLPLSVAISIHGGILYLCYFGTYVLNGWLARGMTPMIVFSLIFILGFLAIWAIIYFIVKRKTRKLNEAWARKQQAAEEEAPQ